MNDKRRIFFPLIHIYIYIYIFFLFLALIFGASIDEIYSGFWGFNTLLTGISLGGFFYTFNGQMVAATIVAIVYTMIVQYSILFLFKNVIKFNLLFYTFDKFVKNNIFTFIVDIYILK